MNFRKYFRIILWLVVLFGAVVAIGPSFTDGFDSNLEFGIEIEGGSWINLALEGNIIQADGDRDAIVDYFLANALEGATFSVSESTDDYILYAVQDAVEEAITWAAVTVDTDANTIKVEASEMGAVAQMLEAVTDGSMVTVFGMDNEQWYEVRRSLTDEEETIALDMTDSEFEGYLKDWYQGELGSLVTITALENRVSPETTEDTADIISTKLNYLGLSDIPVKTIEDNRYISIEFAGKELGEAEALVTEQGKFEIKIVVSEPADETESRVYELIVDGGNIETVDHYTKSISTGQWYVPFTLTSDGAQSFVDKCIEFGARTDPDAHHIVMLLDDMVIFDAPINTTLAQSIEDGTWAKDGGLQASFGYDEEDGYKARNLWIQMNAGALPVKQRIITKGYTSPVLGDVFLRQILYAGIGAILAVGIIVYLRYGTPKIVLPLLATAFSETIIVLGIAVLINHQLDLPSIAGVLATLGTGVDQMVIISDEVLRGEDAGSSTKKLRTSLSKRVSNAFSIIFASAATTIVAMTPLAYMQLGVLRGFAIVTIIGILVGIFITRPSYAKIINILMGKETSTKG